MKRNVLIIGVALFSSIWMILSLTAVQAACRNPNVADWDKPLFRRAAAAGFVEIKWFGHAFFQITSGSGTRIITDPFRHLGFPMPEVWPHVVTVSKESTNHSNVDLAEGDPLILRGLTSWGLEWNVISTTFRDVLIYNVPIHTRNWYDHLKGSAFVFELDGLCICHTGDVGEPFNEDQLDLIGHVDIVLVPIGGRYAMGPENAKKVVAQLKPKIVVPMHYYHNTTVLRRFLGGPYPVRFLNSNNFTVNKDTLPPVTEIYVLKVVREGDL